jgi:hypothetical protein
MRSRNLARITPDQLRELHQGWLALLDDWAGLRNQRRSRYCRRQVRAIERAARRRRIRL